MQIPLGFHGSIRVAEEATNPERLLTEMRAALSAQGAREITTSGTRLNFRGVEQLAISPLQGIGRSEIEISLGDSEIRVVYRVRFALHNLMLAMGVLIFGVTLMYANEKGAVFLASFGGALVAATIVHFSVIRIWFPRWLRRVVYGGSLARS